MLKFPMFLYLFSFGIGQINLPAKNLARIYFFSDDASSESVMIY